MLPAEFNSKNVEQDLGRLLKRKSDQTIREYPILNHQSTLRSLTFPINLIVISLQPSCRSPQPSLLSPPSSTTSPSSPTL